MAGWGMIRSLSLIVALSFGASLCPAIEPIPRKLPPPGIELSAAQRAEVAAARDHVAERMVGIGEDQPRLVDVEIYHKAIAYALEFGEFYKPKDLEVVRSLVMAADRVADEIAVGKEKKDGLRVCGYRSKIDGSVQPYGLEVPEGLDLSKPVPLWVWLHGRGDKTTDLYFIDQRLKKQGQFRPDNAIVLHPFGRQCIGWKSAGEIDVFEAIEDVAKRYKIDRDRIALMGFSMGGAGAWHIGAHYTDQFALVHAGAGFAETARYTKLKKEDFPPSYEQTLWGVYDVPGYVRNLFNVPVVAYSGEIDKQIQAARVMEEAFAGEGKQLRHLIGPGMGHKYHPDTRKEIQQIVAKAVADGREVRPKKVSLQTRTLRYNRMHWVTATGLVEHWKDSRIDAAAEGDMVKISTKNIRSLSIDPLRMPIKSVEIAGKRFRFEETDQPIHLHLADAEWKLGREPGVAAAWRSLEGQSHKVHGLQGPIDDVFLSPFMVVLPTEKSASPKVQAWIEFELAHFEQRWRGTFRGELRKKTADQVTIQDIKRYHLIAFGTPKTNAFISIAVKSWADLKWDAETLDFAGKQLPAASHLPLMIRPNPHNPRKYLVINSGPTFREGHDRTNSLQNPKLPDWALLDLSQAPNGVAAGRVVAADFFGENWKLKKLK